MEIADHSAHEFYPNDVHRRAIYLYVNSNFSAPLIVDHFAKEGTIVPRRTVVDWLKRYDETGQIYNKSQEGKAHHKTIPDSTINKICELQDQNNATTLADIQSNLPDPKPSIASIGRILKQHDYTTKQLYNTPEAKNTDLTKAKRIEFIENAQDYFTENNVLYVDESPFSETMKRNRGRSKKGKKAIKLTRVTRGTNISVIAAIAPKYGLIYYETHQWSEKEGGVNGQRFLLFMNNLLKKSLLRTTPFHIILDNSRIHPRVELEDLFERKGRRNARHYLFYQAPYSPFLNICEEAFAMWKRHGQRSQLKGVQAVLAEIEAGKGQITPELCQKLYEHTLRFFPQMMDGEDIV